MEGPWTLRMIRIRVHDTYARSLRPTLTLSLPDAPEFGQSRSTKSRNRLPDWHHSLIQCNIEPRALKKSHIKHFGGRMDHSRLCRASVLCITLVLSIWLFAFTYVHGCENNADCDDGQACIDDVCSYEAFIVTWHSQS